MPRTERKPGKAPARPVASKPEDLLLANQGAWAEWLAQHHAESPGIWLILGKKGSGVSTPTYAEALEIALCFGWIDGQKGARNAKTWAQRFTRRGPRSIWSQINVQKAEALAAAGRMKPAGLAAVAAAQEDGRWAAAYASQRTIAVPEDLQSALDAVPKAKAFFAQLDSANRYAVLFRIHAAKRPQKRRDRIARFVSMLARHEKLHP
jgi:uncharacterized protein YdeI (YjbR/CyaY-like superfamily)